MKSDKKELLLFSVVAFAVTFIYYGRFLGNFFYEDDFMYIENILHGPLGVMLSHNTGRVISNSIWWPLYYVSGFDPFIYNLFSLILHSANAILLCLFLSRLLKDKGYAILGGAIFLFSAVGCDAVFWKASNNTLISLFFYLTTLYTYIIYRQGGYKVYRMLSIIFFLFAMFSKEDAASMPFTVILIELIFFGGINEKKAVLRRVAPYVAGILFYILLNRLVFNYLLHFHDVTSRFFQFRPLYTLFAGWTVFFLPPDSNLKMSDPAIYLTALVVILSFLWVKDRRALYFGYGWIFFSFLPQSLTNIGQFTPHYFIGSISRYLYIPSIGSSIVLAAIILRVREKLPAKIYYFVTVVFLSLFIWLNYGRVQARGEEWQQRAGVMIPFLDLMKKNMPDFPPNSHVFVVDTPTPRSYMQSALRAYYKRTDIYYIYSPKAFTPKAGEKVFLILCDWKDGSPVDLHIEGLN